MLCCAVLCGELPEPWRAGIVVLMLDSKMEPSIAKDMVRGAADTLYSGERACKLSYHPSPHASVGPSDASSNVPSTQLARVLLGILTSPDDIFCPSVTMYGWLPKGVLC